MHVGNVCQSVSQSVSQSAKQMHLKEVQSYVGLLLNRKIDRVGPAGRYEQYEVSRETTARAGSRTVTTTTARRTAQGRKIEPNGGLKIASNYLNYIVLTKLMAPL